MSTPALPPPIVTRHHHDEKPSAYERFLNQVKCPASRCLAFSCHGKCQARAALPGPEGVARCEGNSVASSSRAVGQLGWRCVDVGRGQQSAVQPGALEDRAL